MYCKNCGSKMADDSNFCKTCGTSVLNEENSMVETGNFESDLGYIYRACTAIMVSLFVVLAGAAIYPLGQLNESENTVLVATVLGSIFMIVSLAFDKNLLIIADGMLIGGIFSLGYSIVRSLSTNEMSFTFFIVTIGLVTTLYTGFLRFLRTEKVEEDLVTE